MSFLINLSTSPSQVLGFCLSVFAEADGQTPAGAEWRMVDRMLQEQRLAAMRLQGWRWRTESSPFYCSLISTLMWLTLFSKVPHHLVLFFFKERMSADRLLLKQRDCRWRVVPSSNSSLIFSLISPLCPPPSPPPPFRPSPTASHPRPSPQPPSPLTPP